MGFEHRFVDFSIHPDGFCLVLVDLGGFTRIFVISMDLGRFGWIWLGLGGWLGSKILYGK